jgi:pilus assembly protein CpaB
MRAAMSLRTWKHRPVLIAAPPVAIALLLFLADAYSKGAIAPAPKAPLHPISVMVAANELPVGRLIVPSDLRTKTMNGAAPTGAFSSQDNALGRITIRSFAPGEVLVKSSLRDPDELGIAARVPQGQRAFSIRVAEDEIVGGFLQSSDRVDIFATIPGSVFAAKDAQSLSDRSRTVLLLQNVLVLAVGENPATRGSVQTGARTVSISLPPKELARLALAIRFGKVSLAIRKTGDMTMTEGASATLADLVPPPELTKTSSVTGTRRATPIPFYEGTRTTTARWSNAP